MLLYFAIFFGECLHKKGVKSRRKKYETITTKEANPINFYHTYPKSVRIQL